MGISKKHWLILIFAFVIVFVIIPLIIILVVNRMHLNGNTLLNPYYYSCIIGSLFSGLTIIIVIISQQSQNKLFQVQRFETTFFNMLNLQQQIVRDLLLNVRDVLFKADSPTEVNNKIQGRELFSYLFEGKPNGSIVRFIGMRKTIQEKGEDGYIESNKATYFDHYFRHLYTIIKFIDKTDFFNDDEKYKYTSIVRATLSRYELVWLYYNCLFGYGNKKFKPLVERYSLLKNIRRDLLAFSKKSKNSLEEKKIEYNKLNANEFSGTDYEFYITNEERREDKYYIGAFYNHEGLEKGKNEVTKWEEFMNNEPRN